MCVCVLCICCFVNSITGLTAIVTSNCTENEPSLATNLAWNDYVNPCALLLLYFYFAFETNRTFFQRVNYMNYSFFNDSCETNPSNGATKTSCLLHKMKTFNKKKCFIVFISGFSCSLVGFAYLHGHTNRHLNIITGAH
jgi:hypothetical protein